MLSLRWPRTVVSEPMSKSGASIGPENEALISIRSWFTVGRRCATVPASHEPFVTGAPAWAKAGIAAFGPRAVIAPAVDRFFRKSRLYGICIPPAPVSFNGFEMILL